MSYKFISSNFVKFCRLEIFFFKIEFVDESSKINFVDEVGLQFDLVVLEAHYSLHRRT